MPKRANGDGVAAGSHSRVGIQGQEALAAAPESTLARRLGQNSGADRPSDECTVLQERLGERIKDLRDAHGLSREELAEKVDLTPQNIFKIENGERFISADSLARLADAFGVAVSELFRFTVDERGKSEAKSKFDLLVRNLPDRYVTLVHDIAARILKEFT